LDGSSFRNSSTVSNMRVQMGALAIHPVGRLAHHLGLKQTAGASGRRPSRLDDARLLQARRRCLVIAGPFDTPKAG